MKSQLAFTILIACLIMGVVIASLAIGYLLTGKPRLKRGCGYIPKKNIHDTDEQNSRCSLCGNKKACEEEKEPRA